MCQDGAGARWPCWCGTRVRGIDRVMRTILPILLFLLAGCGGAADEANQANAGGEVPPGAAELAQDPELANEAAADEAADIENFGGSAAAIDANAAAAPDANAAQ